MLNGLSAVSAVVLVAGCMLALPQARHGESTGQETLGDGGAATAAVINGPNAVVVDGRNTLSIAEGFRAVVRCVDLRTGIIGTVHTREPLKVISSLALDSTGNLIVLDESRVRKVQLSDGSVKDIVAGQDRGWFSGDGGPAKLWVGILLGIPRKMAFRRLLRFRLEQIENREFDWSHPPGSNRRPADYETIRVKSHV
jgi:hypothetical protein